VKLTTNLHLMPRFLFLPLFVPILSFVFI
jgi:hypothetical protein